MTTRIDLPGRGEPLDVRVRLVLAGDGTETRRATVHCTTHGCSKTIEECMSCERCAGLHFDPGHGRSSVLCGWTPAHGLSVSSLPKHWREKDDASATTPISALMPPEVVCVRAEMRLETLTALLLDRSIGGVPVVDGAGRPIGVVSKTDLLRSSNDPDLVRGTRRARGEDAWEHEASLGSGFHAEPADDRTVADIMTPVPLALDESTSVAQAAALMAYESVHRLAVVSATQEVIGVISTLDILRWMAQRNGYLVPPEPRTHRT